MIEKTTTTETDEAAPRVGAQFVIETYIGNQAAAATSFQADSTRMASLGYFPAFQSWEPGQWRTGAFIAALLLCFLIVGIPVLIYMLIVTPDGMLIVTYAFRGSPVDEKATNGRSMEEAA